MRYIVVTLILANVLYFGWRFLSPPKTVPLAVVAAVDKSQIQLIEDSDDVVAEIPAATVAPTPTTDSAESTTEVSASAQDIANVSAANEMQSPASTAQANESSPPTPTPTLAEPIIPPPHCIITPWTRDEKQLQQWRTGINDGAIETLTQEVETQRRFLVYIPAKATPAQTLERLREIKKLTIESAHINKGEYIGGISLGLFSQLESAQAVLKQAHDLGISDAKQTVRLLTATEFRLRHQTIAALSEPWTLCSAP